MLRSRVGSIAFAACFTLFAGCGTAPNDQAITTNIQSRMFSDPQTKSANISVTADHGNITLAGEVPDEATRDEVFKVAQQTPGVKNVYDRMAVQQAAAQEADAVPVPEPKLEPSRAKVPSRSKAAEPKLTRRQKQQAALREAAVRRQTHAIAPPSPQSAPAPDDRYAPPAPAAPSAPEPVAASAAAPTAPTPPPPQPRRVEIPSGTAIRVQLVDPVDTSVNHPGDVFRATLAAPIVVGDEAVVPTGTDVFVKLIDATSAGRIKGTSTVQLQLARMEYQGTSYTLVSDDYNQAGKSRTKRSVETIGGAAAVGAIIGAIAGGGKGAAIGAGVGGAGGTAVQGATHGEQIRLPAETKLDFSLQEPVAIHYFPDKNRQRP